MTKLSVQTNMQLAHMLTVSSTIDSAKSSCNNIIDELRRMLDIELKTDDRTALAACMPRLEQLSNQLCSEVNTIYSLVCDNRK